MQELARAKVNLSLHITGRRTDGYHLLDSLVVFPEIGDVLRRQGEGLTISGPFSGSLSTHNNLVLRAASLLGVNAGLHLEKNLPVASGIGGGSADAAATLRLLGSGQTILNPESLGADVPACLLSKPLRMRGIGDQINLLPALPKFAIVLVNAGAPVATPEVFGALEGVDNAASPDLPATLSRPEFFAFITAQRNDMQAAALAICPSIAEVISALIAQPDCEVARMSGSGGTCFGLFENLEKAERAAAKIKHTKPDWWVAAAWC